MLIMSFFLQHTYAFNTLGIQFFWEQLYGTNKLEIDHYLQGWKGAHFLDYFSLRLCFIYLVMWN